MDPRLRGDDGSKEHGPSEKNRFGVRFEESLLGALKPSGLSFGTGPLPHPTTHRVLS